MKLSVARVLTKDGWLSNQVVEVSQGVVSSISPVSDGDSTAKGTLIPGLIDTQVNGGGGILFNQTPTLEGIDCMAKAHLRFGTTGMLPTLITDCADVMARAADAVACAMSENLPTILGIHYEGPFLSTAKKGVHDASFIRVPTDKELASLMRKDIGKVMVTLAPESVPTSFIKELVAEDVLVCLGHSNANAEQVFDAIEAGATGFTHLYNAMSPLTSREPGMVGAALLADSAYCGLIVDHHHVHPKSAEFAIKAKGKHKTMLVTDAMAHVGTDLDKIPFFNTEIRRTNDKLTTPQGTLAGSCLDMIGAVRNTHQDLHVALEDAVVMASTTPATFLGMSHTHGAIGVGMQANFLLIDDNLNIEKTWLKGELV